MSKVAIFYLTTIAIAGSMFVFCSFWVYHYVELDQEIVEAADNDIELPILGFSAHTRGVAG